MTDRQPPRHFFVSVGAAFLLARTRGRSLSHTIGESTSQVNFRVVKQGKETLDKIFAAPVADEKAE